MSRDNIVSVLCRVTPRITSTLDPPALLPLTPDKSVQTDVLEEDVLAPPSSLTETLTREDRVHPLLSMIE